MITIFTATGNDLKGVLESRSYEDIQDNIHSSTFYKGEDYYENGYVSDAMYSHDKIMLTAEVQGSLTYKVTIRIEDGDVSGKCTCPVGGICKHIVAVLLYAINEKASVEISVSRGDESRINKHLQSLSKNALINLVIKYAPEEFLIETNNKYSDHSEAETVFRKTEKSIRKIFDDPENLYGPFDFEAILVKQLKKLSGLEKHIKKDLGELILLIIREVEKAFDQGYLYDDYNDGLFESPEEFDSLVKNYIQSLPYNEKIIFLQQLDAELSKASYSTFEHLSSLKDNIFSDADLPELKTMLLKNFNQLSNPLVEKYYGLVRHLLSVKEKETILFHLKNDTQRFLELVELYEIQSRQNDALNTIKQWLKEHSGQYGNEKVFSIYLDLLRKQNIDIISTCKEAISYCATSTMLQKIEALKPGNIAECEFILEQKNADGLLDYLEKGERLPEALALINRNKNIWESRVYDFFKKHKKNFKKEAEKHFCERVNKNLQSTGDAYYHTVADTLKQIKQINSSLASELIVDIRANYNRRRNLITIISKI